MTAGWAMIAPRWDWRITAILIAAYSAASIYGLELLSEWLAPALQTLGPR